MNEQNSVKQKPANVSPAPTSSSAPVKTVEVAQTSENSVANKPSKLLKTLLFVVIFVIGVGFILWLVLSSITPSNNESDDDTNKESEVTSTIGTSDVEMTVSVTSPTNGKEVDGEISVQGISSPALGDLSVIVYDDQNTNLGNKNVLVDKNSEKSTLNWQDVVYVSSSPETEQGYLLVFPSALGRDADLTAKVNITFKSNEAGDRIKLFGPLNNQQINSTRVVFRGEMQNFFEGTMNIRLKNEVGKVIYTGYVMPEGDNYGKFSSFRSSVDFESLPQDAGKNGAWELYEISAKDGTEEVLLTIDAIFP